MFLGLAARLAGRAVGALASRAFGQGARRAAGVVAGTIGGGVAVNAISQRMGGGFGGPPGPPPGFAPQGGGRTVPRPREGIVGRTISRIAPGGMTGYEGVALDQTEYNKYGQPIAVGATAVERYAVPSGYVLVRDARVNGGNAFGMLKGAARSLGLWHPKPKPLISGYDTRAIQRAHRVKKKVAKIAKRVAKL